jgi:hypothetical protein
MSASANRNITLLLSSPFECRVASVLPQLLVALVAASFFTVICSNSSPLGLLDG